ncbi:unnamed protein product [Trichobilharzia regenti]|nr:unnamed protein product [Trichobilharzia regenti]
MNQYVTDINATNIQRCQQFHPTELPVKYSSSVQRHSTSIYASCPLTGSCTDLGMIEKGAESQHNKTYTVNTSCTESVCSVKFTKPQYHTDMKDNYNDVDDDDDDKAERDITESIDENIQNCQKSTKIASNLLGKRKEKIDTNEIPNKKLSPSKFTSVKLNSLLKHKHKHFRSTAIQVGAGKYNRLTSGQVKNNKNTYVNFERDYNSSPIVLKVKRAHSLQSLSSEPTSINVFKKGVSFSTNKKAFIQHGGNLAQEVVIVRTEDQSRSLMNSSERSNDTHSIHLIPAVILNKDGTSSNNEPSLNTLDLADEFEQPVFRPSRAASASGSIRRSGYNRNYDEQVEIGSHHSLQIDDKESTVHGSTVSGSTTRFVRRRSPQQAFRDTINNEGKEESEAQQVSRAMGRVLTASGGTSPTPSLNASTNMLRYSRLLDQLRSDPETLRKLRHEALAQHVDRLAHATIRGSTGNIIELRQPSQRVDVTSNLGVSLPILSVNNDMGSSQSNMTEGMNSLNKRPTGYFESKPRLQRSSPQLQYITEETKSESSASKQQPPSIHQQAHTTSQKYSPSHMNNNNNNNTSNNNNNNNSSINNSSSNGQQKHGTSNSPEIHFSHDQKVVTFGGQSSETNRNLAVVQSSEDDEWDSETEDLNAPRRLKLNLSNSTQKLVNPRNLEVSFYKPSNSNTTTNNNIKQGNNNASIPPNPQGIKYSLYKGQSLKTG